MDHGSDKFDLFSADTGALNGRFLADVAGVAPIGFFGRLGSGPFPFGDGWLGIPSQIAHATGPSPQAGTVLGATA